MKKNESKYFYTAQLMNQALLSLLEKKDIEFISVTEITNKAGVSRSTFYLHYDDIYELLEETIETLNDQFISSFDIKVPLKIKSKDDAFLITDNMLIPYLSFVKKNKNVLRLIRRKPQLFQSKNTYKKMYDKIFYPAISYFLDEEKERIYYLEFFTSGISAIVHKWLDLDCVTEIEDLVEIIKKCIKY
ncbi:MAG: TetR/AcrR family transcriptional regulator [Clostridia bacterium]|nr:TetR/AcrR family transcriptional regulator [Clostridia bacterium]